MDPRLKKYSVGLKEKADDTFSLNFECYAKNPERAVQRARDVYPESQLLDITTLQQSTPEARPDRTRTLIDLYALWDRLADVPVSELGELGEPFEHFTKGEPRERVWQWFEQLNEHFLVGQVLAGVRPSAQTIMQYAQKNYVSALLDDQQALTELARRAAHDLRAEFPALHQSRLILQDFARGAQHCLRPELYRHAMQEAEWRAVDLAQKIHQIEQAGYTIECHKESAITGWWALLPGETAFYDNFDAHEADPENVPHRQNYLGFFSSLEELVDEVICEVQERQFQQNKVYPKF